ncbi:MAG: hypothetical protein P8N58_06290 [Emcibacteraceae bacterium]|nr:hypothetical protein [Emcibacteraceae bacterium]
MKKQLIALVVSIFINPSYAENNTFTIRSSVLSENEIGFFRHVCLLNKQYVSYMDRNGNAEIKQIRGLGDKTFDCDSHEFYIIKEIPISAMRLKKGHSGVLRTFDINEHTFVLITTKGQGSSLEQIFQ